MKLVMTLLVRDEADIIATTIAYHLAQGVDHIIATDNRSEDGTLDILQGYARSGVLSLWREDDDTYDQHAWVTRMARAAASAHGADWVINSDVDEFWWPRQGSLRDTFAKLSGETTEVLAERYNFVMTDDAGEMSFFRRMVYREVASFNQLGDPLPPKVAHRGAPSVDVAQGNHEVTGLPPGDKISGPIEILHFPVRSYRQIENKIAKGGAAYGRNTKLPPEVGSTWRRLYAELMARGDLRDHFASVQHDRQRIAARLAAGEIVEDHRLLRFLAQHNIG
jgi:hypothetical protein